MKRTEWGCALEEADRVTGCGGKAAQLARVLRMGLPVPPGFVITNAALQTFLDHNDLRRTAGELLPPGPEALPDLEALASKLRQRILTSAFLRPFKSCCARCGRPSLPGRP